MQRDLFSAFLAMCVEDDVLNAEKAREIWPAGEGCLSKEGSPWPGLESVLWAALSEIESVSGMANLPTSVGLQRQNGSPRKPELTNAQGQAVHRSGSGVVISGTPRL